MNYPFHFHKGKRYRRDAGRFTTASARVFLGVVSVFLSSLAGAQVVGNSTLLDSFENASDYTRPSIWTWALTAKQVQTGVTNGSYAMELDFNPTSSQDALAEIHPSPGFDISQGSGLAFDVTNPDSTTFRLCMWMMDGGGHTLGRVCDIPGNTTLTLRIGTGSAPNTNPMAYHMLQLPDPFPGMVALTTGSTSSAFNLADIEYVSFYSKYPASGRLIIDNLRCLPSYTLDQLLTGIVDQYGQYTHQSWSSKVAQDSDLTSRAQSEANTLSSSAGFSNRDAYGGWTGGSQQTATGYFYTKQINGKWYFVDPLGNLFWSFGLNSLSHGNNNTLVTNRSYMFTSLPGSTSPLSAFMYQLTNSFFAPTNLGYAFNFYESNLYRKYGANFDSIWHARTLSRLQSWGINTIGDFAADSFYANGQVPYTIHLSTDGNFNHVSTGSDLFGPMPDPFDPGFATNLVSRFQWTCTTSKNDPFLVGYWIDNELSWVGQSGTNPSYALVNGTVEQYATSSPAKMALIAQLQARYGTIQALNKVWKTTFGGWAGLYPPFPIVSNQFPAIQADCDAFLSLYAQKYFSQVNATIKKYDPNHLYLGCRFSGYTPGIVQQCAAYSDVVSFNVYQTSLDPNQFSFITAFNKPVIIGEFSFGASDQGKFRGGLQSVTDQNARATAMTAYTVSALTNPLFIGVGWYEYVDQPTAGDPTGANFNMGMVDETDTPYPALVSAIQAIQNQIYSTRGQ